MRMRKMGFAALGLAALVCAAASSAAVAPVQVKVAVRFSPRAAAWLAQRREGVIAMGSFQGAPARGGEPLAKPDGMILLGVVEQALDASGTATLGLPEGWERRRALLRPGGLELNVNVFSARKASPDNVLDCDFYDGGLDRAVANGVSLSCRLIGENQGR